MKPLTAQQSRFVDAYLSGLTAAEAARKAGFAPAYAAKASAVILKQPAVAAAVEAAQVLARNTAVYGMAEAVRESDRLSQAAEAKGQYMAVARFYEAKLKILGLLQEKLTVTVESVNIRSAIEDAKARVSRVINPVALAAPSEAPSHHAKDRHDADPFGD